MDCETAFMDSRKYIAGKLIDIKVLSGASISTTEDQVNGAFGFESNEEKVHTNVQFNGISTVKLVIADNLVKRVKEQGINGKKSESREEIAEPIVNNTFFSDILCQISKLMNEEEWSIRKMSLPGLLTFLAFVLISVCFSINYMFQYIAIGACNEIKTLLFCYLFPVLSISAICGIILWLLNNLISHTFLQSMAFSGLLLFFASLLKSHLTSPLADAVVYSVLWGCMVILVTGIKFVHGTYDYVSGFHKQGAIEIVDALLVLAGLSMSLWIGQLFGFRIDEPAKVTEISILACAIRILSIGLGSAAFYILFSSDISKHKEVKKIRKRFFGITFFYGCLAETILIIMPYLFSSINELLCEFISFGIVTCVCFFLCRRYLHKYDKDHWSTVILFVPSIVVLIPGCTLCQRLIAVDEIFCLVMAIIIPLNICLFIVNHLQEKSSRFGFELFIRQFYDFCKTVFSLKTFWPLSVHILKLDLEYYKIIDEYLNLSIQTNDKAFSMAACDILSKHIQHPKKDHVIFNFLNKLAEILCLMKKENAYCGLSRYKDFKTCVDAVLEKEKRRFDDPKNGINIKETMDLLNIIVASDSDMDTKLLNWQEAYNILYDLFEKSIVIFS